MPLAPEEQQELEKLRAELDSLGGRGVDIANRIDDLEVKARTPYDQVVYEYGEDLHGYNTIGDMNLNPEADWIMVEENTHGGHYLSTWDDRDRAYAYHMEQEYAEEWLFVKIVNLKTGDAFTPGRVEYTVQWTTLVAGINGR